MRTIKPAYWIERDDNLGPFPKLDSIGDMKAPYVRVFTSEETSFFLNVHGGMMGSLAAVFYGHTTEEAEELADVFLQGIREKLK